VRSPTAESYWVVEAKVLAGKYPGAKFDAAAAAKIGSLVEAGVRAFLDLTESDELVPDRRASASHANQAA
jgi:hypothetical protein